MADLNNCSFTGHLTDAAKQKVLPSGNELIEFDIANNTGWGDHAKTLFIKCTIWGKKGTAVLQYLKKGQLVAVSGSLELQSWTSNLDGQLKQKLALTVTGDVILLGGKPDYSDSISRDEVKKGKDTAYDDRYEDGIPY